MIYTISTISTLFIYCTYFKLSSSQLESEAVSLPIDIAPLSPVLPQRVFASNGMESRESVTEVTILLGGDVSSDGNICPLNGACLNPMVTIKAEEVDIYEPDRWIDIYYGSYTDENIIARCTNHSDYEGCGFFVDCIESFSPPDGCYDQLTFFVYATANLQIECGDDDDELGPGRNWGLQFDIFCESACDSEECNESTRRRRLGGGDLVDEMDHDETGSSKIGYDLQLECKAYDDAFTGFLVFVGICWIVQCGGFYVYKSKKSKKSDRNYTV